MTITPLDSDLAYSPTGRKLQAFGGLGERWTGLLPALLVICWTGVFWNGPLINDVGWQMWIGRRMSEGASLYRDILEINPPLWFWLGEGLVRAGAATGNAPSSLLVALIGGTALAALQLVRLAGVPRLDRLLLSLGLVLTLFLTAPFALGQREQYVLVSTLPYVVLLAARMEGRHVPTGAVAAIALLAASGIALKQYFLLLPALLELWLIVRRRTVSIRLEHGVLVLAGAAYLAAILLLTPDYLRVMVPLIRTAYGGFDMPLIALIGNPAILVVGAASGLLLLGRPGALGQAAGIAAAAFAAAFIVQAKNFPYQAIPALGFAIGSALLAARRSEGRRPALLLLIVIACAAIPWWGGGGRSDQRVAEATADLPRGSAIMVLTSSGAAAWPLVEERGFTWHSPHMMLWMLAPYWQDELTGAPDRKRKQLADAVRLQVARELACQPPARLLVDRRYDALLPGLGVLGWFRREPAFAAALTAYERGPDSGHVEVWKRRPDTPAACPAIRASVPLPAPRP